MKPHFDSLERNSIVVDARIMHHKDYQPGSIGGAVRATLDSMKIEDDALWITQLIDKNGTNIDTAIFRDVIKRVRKVGEQFKSRTRLGVIGVWRTSNAHAVDAEFEKKPSRKKWPLLDMEIGQTVEIEQGQYGKANPQTYAHNLAKQTGRKFKTRRNGATFIIERIA